MSKIKQQVRTGMTAGGNFCLGFSPPIEVEMIQSFSRGNGLLPYIEPNQDGSQTVGYQRLQFGYCEGSRWECFEEHANKVIATLASTMVGHEVVFHFNPVVLEPGQTSLYINEEVAA